MSYIKCKYCGAKVSPLKNPHFGSCEVCSENQTIPVTSDENAIALFNNAQTHLTNREFEKGYVCFTELTKILPCDSEGYFKSALCKYGVYYNDKGKRYECSIYNNVPFEQCEEYINALEFSDFDISTHYKKIALDIDSFRDRAIDTGEAEIYYSGDSKLLIKAFVALNNEDWLSASEFAEDELQLHPESGQAYLCKLLAELQIKQISDTVTKNIQPFDHLQSFQYAVKFADEETKAQLIQYSDMATKRYNEKIYDSAVYLEKSTSIAAVKKAIELFTSVIDYKDSSEKIEECKKHLEILEYKYRIYDAAATIFADKGMLSDAALLYQRAEDGKMTRRYLTHLPRPIAASNHTTVLLSNGRVLAKGENKYGQCNVESWDDIVSVACSYSHTLGLKKDGTVLALGGTGSRKCDVFDWKDIKAIAAGPGHSVGLKKDGTVIAIGYGRDDRCKVSEWKNIVSIKAGDTHTVGLTDLGTVVSTGANDYGQCDVSHWTDIIALSVGEFHTVGLKRDGTVVATGKNTFGECNVSEWNDIVGIAAGDDHTVGLKNDGTVVSVGSNEFGQCDVSRWGEIICLSAGSHHTVGLHPDGSIIATGKNDDGRCDISDIKVYISSSEELLSLVKTVDNETDYTVLFNLATQKEKEAESILEKIIAEEEAEGEKRRQAELLRKEADRKKKAENAERVRISKIQLEEKRKAEAMLAAERKAKGLCPYCGGAYKGLFYKKCSSCGKPMEK